MRDISSTGPRLHRDAPSPAPPLPRPAHRFAPPALPGRWGSCERVPFSSSSTAPCLPEQTHGESLWSGSTSAPVRGRGREGRGGGGRGDGNNTQGSAVLENYSHICKILDTIQHSTNHKGDIYTYT